MLSALVAKSPLAGLFSSPRLEYLPVVDDGQIEGKGEGSGLSNREGPRLKRVELKVGGMTVSACLVG